MTKNDIQVEKNNKIQKYKSTGDILLQSQPEKLGIVLGENGEEVVLKEGEIAFCIADKKANDLELGEMVYCPCTVIIYFSTLLASLVAQMVKNMLAMPKTRV